MNQILNSSSSSGGLGSVTIDIVLVVIVVGVVIFSIVSSILNKKNRQKEKDKRKKEVKEKIKEFIKEKENVKNIGVEFEKVIACKGKKYKNRDVFEVIIKIFDPKTNKLIEERAYEIEGISIEVAKKKYRHEWVINSRLDLEHTKRRFKIIEGKIKLNKNEKKLQRKQYKQIQRQQALEEKKKNKEKYSRKKEFQSIKEIDYEQKFVPKRSKKD